MIFPSGTPNGSTGAAQCPVFFPQAERQLLGMIMRGEVVARINEPAQMVEQSVTSDPGKGEEWFFGIAKSWTARSRLYHLGRFE